MLKCKIIREKDHIWVKTKGTGEDILTETLALIQTIYQSMRKQNEEAAEAYRLAVIAGVLDPTSPVFKKEDKT